MVHVKAKGAVSIDSILAPVLFIMVIDADPFASPPMNKPGLRFLQNPVHLLALGCGAGYTPRLPGTAGTLVGVILYLVLPELPLLYYLGLLAVLFASGIWICGRTMRDLGVHDHPAIVYDEIIGYLITMTLAPPGWWWIAGGFVLFRLFDIWKPWPIRWLDRRVQGGLGVMLDDLAAGLFALLAMQLFSYLMLPGPRP